MAGHPLTEWKLTAAQSFTDHPHRTLVALSVPILGSLVAEPLTGLVDTAFVARLGVEALAALGAGTMLLSALIWGFSFLGVATQTRVALLGGGDREGGASDRSAARLCLVAMTLATVLGCVAAVIGVLYSDSAARAMGAEGGVADLSVVYLRLRLIGLPAMLASLAAFGALRGAHDMRTPLWIAAGMNALNLVLDPLLIFGLGGFPAMGLAGAAIASTLSQWVGAFWAAAAAMRRLGRPDGFDWRHARGLLSTGVDLFLRAAALNGFLIMGTRRATLIGAEAGAVHQVVRSTWFFNALFLDSFAISGQSLVAHFLGRRDRRRARHVALVVCQWSFGTGAVLGLLMLVCQPWVQKVYIPAEAVALFGMPWLIAAVTQPVSGLSFGTDGVQFGSSDFAFLRNSVLSALVAGVSLMWSVEVDSPHAMDFVWWSFTAWAAVRAAAGTLRVWPGLGAAPLKDRI